MQSYFYNEYNQTDYLLPLLVAVSSNRTANSGTIIMPELGIESVAIFSVQPLNYSLPQIAYPLRTQRIFIDGATVSIFYIPEREQEVVDTEIESLSRKVIKLYDILGEELFSKLNRDQLMFMINTAGVVDLGENVDIQRMYEYINQYQQ